MTFSYTNEDTGNEYSFPSEDAYEAALEWYNKTAKSDIIIFCERRGVSLDEPTEDPYYKNGVKLVADWHDIAMQAYAQQH